MKKELFLVVGVLGVLSLSACDARDEKKINAAIKDKSDAEIVQMVVDANKEETLTDVYSDGLKLDGEFKMKGDLAALESSSGFGSVTASGSLDISGDISGVYNASGVQASANVKAKINMKTVVTEGVTTETKIDLKGSATAESLNDEADAYLYAKISGTAASTKLDQEYKYKFKKDSSNSGIGDIISDIDLSKIDITELKAVLGSAAISVDDGMLLFTWENEALNSLIGDEVTNAGVKNLKGKASLGFDKNFHIKNVNIDIKADEMNVSASSMLNAKLENPSIYLNVDVKDGSYSIKSLKDKDTYSYVK